MTKENCPNRTFIETPNFTKKWISYGLTDEELRLLENILLKDPKSGKIIQGTGGIRKIRIPYHGQGKRSGGRVIYIDIEVKEKIYLLDFYIKNETINLTAQEQDFLKKLVQILREE